MSYVAIQNGSLQGSVPHYPKFSCHLVWDPKALLRKLGSQTTKPNHDPAPTESYRTCTLVWFTIPSLLNSSQLLWFHIFISDHIRSLESIIMINNLYICPRSPWQFMVPHPINVPRCALSRLSRCRLVHAVQPRYPGFGEPVRLVHGTADASRRPGNCGGAMQHELLNVGKGWKRGDDTKKTIRM